MNGTRTKQRAFHTYRRPEKPKLDTEIFFKWIIQCLCRSKTSCRFSYGEPRAPYMCLLHLFTPEGLKRKIMTTPCFSDCDSDRHTKTQSSYSNTMWFWNWSGSPWAVKYQCQERAGHMDSHVSTLSASLPGQRWVVSNTYSQSHRDNHLCMSVSCHSESLSMCILFINIWGDCMMR